MKIQSIYKKISICTILIIGLSVSGCKKFVEIPAPVDSVPAELAFNTDTKADASIRAIYYYWVGGSNLAFGGVTSASLGLSSDELAVGSVANTYNDFYLNTVASSSTPLTSYIWAPAYNVLYMCNIAIENIDASTGMTAAAKKQYAAEAHFVRAAIYFYLVNLFGDVPMPVSSDYVSNASLARAPVSQVYDLILADLKFAQANLSTTYVGGTQRYRANRFAASALLARAYLFLKDYPNAEAAATDVIEGSGSMYSLETTNLSNAFLTTSKEVILQILQPGTNAYTWEGAAFSGTTSSIPNYLITDALYTSFEAGDLRKTNWIKTTTVSAKPYYSPYKYKLSSGSVTAGAVRAEAMVFLRLADVYLIRAEARAQQPAKLASAIADLDVVRKRANISLIATTKPGIVQADLLTTIAHERFVEMFAELGSRWLDLKRTDQADIVLKNKANWRPEAKLFPIPATEITYDPLLTQNPGYN